MHTCNHHVSERHTGENTATILKSVQEEFSIMNVAGLTTDNTSNITVAATLADCPYSKFNTVKHMHCDIKRYVLIFGARHCNFLHDTQQNVCCTSMRDKCNCAFLILYIFLHFDFE